MLRAAVERGRLPHAYLFSGPEGVGKLTAAKVLVRALNCNKPGPDLEPCNRCTPCRKLLQGNHPDLIELAPEKGREILVAAIRELKRTLRFPSREARVRPVLVDQADRLNISAANAFLKLLEEPGKDNLFILVTDSPHRLPSTVVSRCQRIGFGTVPQGELAAWLQDRHGWPVAKASLAAALTAGSPGRALELSDDDLGKDRRDLLGRTALLFGDGPDRVQGALDLAAELARADADRHGALSFIAFWLRDLLLTHHAGLPEQVANVDLLDLLSGAPSDPDRLLDALAAVEQTQNALWGNAAPQLAFETLFLSFVNGRSSC